MATLSSSLSSERNTAKLRQFDAYRDLGPVADLIETCFRETLDPDGKSYLRRMRSIASQPRLLRWAASSTEASNIPFFGYVWEQDGLIVGNASLIPYKIHGKRLFLVANVAVHPDYRRQGIARRLTLQVIQHARQRQASSVWLHVRQENETAIRLYSELGFLERACRSTWISTDESMGASAEMGVRIVPAQIRHWEKQRYWLAKNYPPELSWHMSFEPEVFNPGIKGIFQRIFRQVYIQQWSVLDGKDWLGSATWQFSTGYTNLLWLSVPPKTNEQVVYNLLGYVRQHANSRKPLALDYPSNQLTSAMKLAGFRCQQTLIWMELLV